MNIWHRIPLALKILIPGAAVVAFVGFSKPKPTPSVPPEPPPPASVNVIYAAPSTEVMTIQTQGTVEPRREIDLIAQVGGLVTHVNEAFIDGGFFERGDILLEIDPRDYAVALTRAESGLATAQMQLAEEKGRARQAKREWRDLGNDDANNLFLRRPQLTAAQANVESAQADVAQAKLNLERTKVLAPFSGRIREIRVDLGQYAAPNAPVARVYDTSTAQILLPLTDREAALIALPLTTDEQKRPTVSLSATVAGEERVWQGEITRTSASVDTQSRMFSAFVEVQREQQRHYPLIIGLFVNASITSKEIENVLKLPREAVFKRDQLFVVDGNQVRSKHVEVLAKNDDFIWVRNTSIASGTPIIDRRQGYLSPGMDVVIQNDAEHPRPENTPPDAPEEKADVAQVIEGDSQ